MLASRRPAPTPPPIGSGARSAPPARAGALAAAALCALAAALAGPLRATQAHAATRPPACATAGLVVWLETGGGGGAAGSTFYELEFTNLSGHTCSLSGYPGVSAVSLRGHRVGAPATREHSSPARAITLANGASAKAALRIVEAGNYPSSACAMTTAAGLRVYPPGQTGSRIVPFPFPACTHTGSQILSVRALVRR